jgi:DNA-directed RNA polymerase subunit RPC12/RpoP
MICKRCGKPATRTELAAVKCSACGNKTFRLGPGADPRVRLPSQPERSQPL